MKRKYMKTLAVMFCMGTCLTACSPGSEDVAEKKAETTGTYPDGSRPQFSLEK